MVADLVAAFVYAYVRMSQDSTSRSQLEFALVARLTSPNIPCR
jgi:hypothetical protein